MSKKWIALLLAVVLALSLCAIPALAQNEEAPGETEETGTPEAAAEETGGDA